MFPHLTISFSTANPTNPRHCAQQRENGYPWAPGQQRGRTEFFFKVYCLGLRSFTLAATQQPATESFLSPRPLLNKEINTRSRRLPPPPPAPKELGIPISFSLEWILSGWRAPASEGTIHDSITHTYTAQNCFLHPATSSIMAHGLLSFSDLSVFRYSNHAILLLPPPPHSWHTSMMSPIELPEAKG